MSFDIRFTQYLQSCTHSLVYSIFNNEIQRPSAVKVCQMPAALEFPTCPGRFSRCTPLEVQATSYFAASASIVSFSSIVSPSFISILPAMPFPHSTRFDYLPRRQEETNPQLMCSLAFIAQTLVRLFYHLIIISVILQVFFRMFVRFLFVLSTESHSLVNAHLL